MCSARNRAIIVIEGRLRLEVEEGEAMTIAIDRNSTSGFEPTTTRRHTYGAETVKDGLLLLCRALLMLLFIKSGWGKLTGYTETIHHFAQTGVPMPALAATIAVGMEFFAGLAIVFGVLTRPLAILLAIYTFGTALLGHHYWTMKGPAQVESEINFYKNISIIGGFFLLYLTGAGKYSVDEKIGLG
jgi:putative oxidoreductase